MTSTNVKFAADLKNLIEKSGLHAGECMMVMAMAIGRIVASCKETKGEEMAAKIMKVAIENMCEEAGAEIHVRMEVVELKTASQPVN